MLLQRLTEYTHRLSGELPPEFYRHKQVKCVLDIRRGGTAAELIVRPKGSARQRTQLPSQAVPHVQRSGQKVPPYLLVDTAEFVLGVPKPAAGLKEPSAKEIEEARRRHDAYRDLALRWAGEDGGPGGDALRAFFANGGTALLDMPEEVEAGDLVAVMAGGKWLHEEASARALWGRVVRERKGGPAGSRGICLVCGELGALLTTIPEPVKKGAIPTSGGSNEGQLVSINKEAQGRDGVTQLVNTPICDGCGSRAMAALNHLLGSQNQRQTFPDGAAVWWTREPDHDDVMALLRRYDQNAPQDTASVAHLINVLRQEASPAAVGAVEANDFYMLSLGLNNARIVVRDWLDVPLARIKANAGAWFEDHGVHDGWTGETRYVPLWLMALACGRAKDGRYVKDTAPKNLDVELFSSALSRTPPPARTLSLLLQRIRDDRQIDTPRIALLRLILNRSSDDKDHVMPRLDLDSTDPAYLCGRMFAILENIQRVALGKQLNTTLRDKYFATAVTAPASVMVRLHIDAVAHLKKLRGGTDKSKAAGWALQGRLTDVFTQIEDDFPTHLSPQRQGRFIIGYEHQRAAHLAAARAAGESRRNGTEDDAEGAGGPDDGE